MPQDYRNLLPRFIGEDDVTTQKHIEVLCAFIENLNVENLDVVLILFVQSIDGEARKLFKTLPNNSINTWEELEKTFMQKWGEKRDHGYYLTEFTAIKKKHNEDVTNFIKKLISCITD